MSASLRLTPGAKVGGLYSFRLGLWTDGKEIVKWAVNSGGIGLQDLRTYGDPDSRPGNREPIPEAVYGVGPTADWKSGRGNWGASWGSGLGPVWIDIYDPGGGRGEFGFHLDANRSQAPGSAGCIVFSDRASLENFLAAFEKYRPDSLVVDFGLGTVPGAPPAVQAVVPKGKAKKSIKIAAHAGKLRAWLGDVGGWFDLDGLELKADYST